MFGMLGGVIDGGFMLGGFGMPGMFPSGWLGFGEDGPVDPL